MGALENMQEEIIPLVPVLLVLGRGLGVDAVAVVAMSAGAAMIGSAFGPTNPFQAGIAMKLAELPPISGAACADRDVGRGRRASGSPGRCATPARTRVAARRTVAEPDAAPATSKRSR